MNKAVTRVEAFSAYASTVSYQLCYVAGLILLFAMGIASCMDIVMRAFGLGIPGIWEAVTLAMRWMIGLALPYTFYRGSHVSVELFTDALPSRLRQGVIVLTLICSVVIMALMAWKITYRLLDIYSYGGVTADLGLPSYLDWLPLALGTSVSIPVLIARAWCESLALFKPRLCPGSEP